MKAMIGKDAPSDLDLSPAALPALVLPDPSRIFLERSRRLTALAEGHSLGGWLSFLGRLTEAQHELLQLHPVLSLPDRPAGVTREDHPEPPLSASFLPREPSWQQTLSDLCVKIGPYAPSAAQEAIVHLRSMGGSGLETLADRVVRLEISHEDGAFLPFVAAALQIHWTALAAGVDPTEVAPLNEPNLCPQLRLFAGWCSGER